MSKGASEQCADRGDSSGSDDTDESGALYQSDEFRMWEMKVRHCSRMDTHDWTACPYAHTGEKAVRRDPRTHNYTGIACPDMRRTSRCVRGDLCPYAHNVFEYWLHPTRYRTQLCNDGPACRRRPCFFAHSLDQLRTSEVRPFVSPETLARVAQEVAAGHACCSGHEAGCGSGGGRCPPAPDSSAPAPDSRPPRSRLSPTALARRGSSGSDGGSRSDSLPRPRSLARVSSGSLATTTTLTNTGQCSPLSDCDTTLETILASLRLERARQMAAAPGTNHEIVISTLYQVLQQAKLARATSGESPPLSGGTSPGASPPRIQPLPRRVSRQSFPWSDGTGV